MAPEVVAVVVDPLLPLELVVMVVMVLYSSTMLPPVDK